MGAGPGYEACLAANDRVRFAVSVSSSPSTTPQTGTARVKRGMADMLKGGVIMDVVTPDQAKIAEDAGASR